MRKRPEITEQTKANLITAFWDRLETQKKDKITIKEITDHAGYYRSTFYEYFTDMSDLIEQAEDLLIQDMEKQAFYSMSNSSLDEIIPKSVKFYSDNSKYLRILLGQNGSPTFALKFKNLLHPMIQKYYHLDDINVETEYVIEFTLSALLGTLTYWFENDKNISIEKLIEIVNPIIKTILNPKLITTKSDT